MSRMFCHAFKKLNFQKKKNTCWLNFLEKVKHSLAMAIHHIVLKLSVVTSKSTCYKTNLNSLGLYMSVENSVAVWEFSYPQLWNAISQYLVMTTKDKKTENKNWKTKYTHLPWQTPHHPTHTPLHTTNTPSHTHTNTKHKQNNPLQKNKKKSSGSFVFCFCLFVCLWCFCVFLFVFLFCFWWKKFVEVTITEVQNIHLVYTCNGIGSMTTAWLRTVRIIFMTDYYY